MANATELRAAASELVAVLDEIQAGRYSDDALIQRAKTLNFQLSVVYTRLYGRVPLIDSDYPSHVWWPRARRHASDALAAADAGMFDAPDAVDPPTLVDETVAWRAEPSEFEYDVALSYAGEDRLYVDAVARALRDVGVRVFYDQFLEANLWGLDLYTFFDDVFRKRARYAVVFVSTAYVTKVWTSHERRSVQARALLEPNDYLLPVRLDDCEVPGLLPTVGIVDGRTKSPVALAALIDERVGRKSDVPMSRLPFVVPRNADEQRQLLAARPDSWEYLLWAGVLLQGKEALEAKWHDHQLHYRPSGGAYFGTRDNAVAYLRSAWRDGEGILSNLDALVAPETQARAFGAPGTKGDPVLIQHLGSRFISMYDDMLGWAERLRSALPPDDMKEPFELAARFMDRPLQQTRDFIDHVVAELSRVVLQLEEPTSADAPIELVFNLTLDADDEIVAAFTKACQKRSGVVW